MNVNVDLSLVELKQIVEALRYEVRLDGQLHDHLPARQSRQYQNHLTELANRLEKLMIFQAKEEESILL